MAVSRVGSWSAVSSSADPSGSVTIGSGTSRVFLVGVLAMKDAFNVASFTIGGVGPTGQYESIDTTDSPDHCAYWYYWNESDIGSMTGSAISWSSDSTAGKFSWAYATYDGIDQTSPIRTQATSFENAATFSGTLDVTTTSQTDDYIVLQGVRTNANRTFTDWDTLTEIHDGTPAAGMRYGWADGSGGDNTTTVTGDTGAGDSMFLNALVLTVEASGSPRRGSFRGVMRGVGRGI